MNDSLADARRAVMAQLEEGSTCPCCGQDARAYKRPLYFRMAGWLLWLVAAHEATGEWVSVQDAPDRLRALVAGGDPAKLAHFGLIEPMQHGRPWRWWRPTEAGKQFARGLLRVPSHVWLFNKRVWPERDDKGFARTTVDIHEALAADRGDEPFPTWEDFQGVKLDGPFRRPSEDDRQIPLFDFEDE